VTHYTYNDNVKMNKLGYYYLLKPKIKFYIIHLSHAGS